MVEFVNISRTLLNETTDVLRTATNARIASSSKKIVYVLLGCVGIIGNLLVVVTITSAKSRVKHYVDLLIVNQSVIDLFSSVFLIATTLTVGDHIRRLSGFADELYCRFWISGYVIWSLFFSSTYNLVLLSLERYMAIVHPLRHYTSLTYEKVYTAMVVVWCVGPIYNMIHRVPTSGLIDGTCYKFVFWPSRMVARVFGVVALLVQFFIPLALLIYAYVLMMLKLRTKVHPVGSTSGPSVSGGASAITVRHGDRNRILKERAGRSIFRTMLTVTACFFLCWVANQVLFLLFNFGHKVDFQSSFYHFTVYIAFANSCVNPIIYTFQYGTFRQGLRELFCRRRVAPLDTILETDVSRVAQQRS